MGLGVLGDRGADAAPEESETWAGCTPASLARAATSIRARLDVSTSSRRRVSHAGAIARGVPCSDATASRSAQAESTEIASCARMLSRSDAPSRSAMPSSRLRQHSVSTCASRSPLPSNSTVSRRAPSGPKYPRGARSATSAAPRRRPKRWSPTARPLESPRAGPDSLETAGLYAAAVARPARSATPPRQSLARTIRSTATCHLSLAGASVPNPPLRGE